MKIKKWPIHKHGYPLNKQSFQEFTDSKKDKNYVKPIFKGIKFCTN